MGITCQPEFIVDEWQSNQDDDSKDVSEKEMLCMNIFPCLVSTDKSRDLISMLCSCFRLLQIGIRFSAEGSLEAIDALLGAAVISPNPRELSNFLETEKEEVQFSIFGTFFLSVSWFRELINAFITQVSLEKDHGKPTEPDEDILCK